MIMEYIKKYLKTALGDHFELFVTRPHRAYRAWIVAFKRSRDSLTKLIRSLPSLLRTKALRRLQLQYQTLGISTMLKPLSLVLRTVIKQLIHWSGGRYRESYLYFGKAIVTLKGNCTTRHGLLLVSGTLGPGGSERQAVLTFLGLAKRGLRPLGLAVVYLRTEHERFYLSRLEAAGMPPTKFNRNTAQDDRGELGQILSIVKLLPDELQDVRDYISTLQSQRPEIVHLWLDEVNVKGGLAAIATGVPKIVLGTRSLPPYNFALYQPYMYEGYCWLAKQPQVTLISNSNAGARAYEQWLGLPAGHIQVVHNGFDFDEGLLSEQRNKRAAYRERLGIPPASPLVGTVMRLSEEKRPLLWAEIAARTLRHVPEAHFVVVGDGPLRAELQAKIAALDLAGRLHLVGYEQQSLAAIAAMDLFLLSSRAEGLPNVLVEAQALGVPVVTTAAGGAQESLAHGQTGWVLSSDNASAAARVIARLLNDRQWLQQAGNAGHDFVKSRFGVERMLDETLQVYGPILSEGKITKTTCSKRAAS